MKLTIYSPEAPGAKATIAGDRDGLAQLVWTIQQALASGSDTRDVLDQDERVFQVEVRMVGVRSETARQVYPGRDVSPEDFKNWPSQYVGEPFREHEEEKWLLL